ncbi:HAD family hydrolase [bacterium]|jgi:D-glycero-D-manno-heptose 1,7-bisphosphate phosphatase|nr:HAD family hydrolase [bacterium]
MVSNKAVFIDRDGTLNHDPGFISRPEDFSFYEGSVKALKDISELGFQIFIVTNQSGLGRGYIKEKDLAEVHDKIRAELKENGINISGILVCPHLPEDNCLCRKPSPYMVKCAADKHDISLPDSFFIGDRESDIRTGKNAGCKTILVLTGNGRETLRKSDIKPDFVVEDIREAVTVLGE